MTTKISFKDWDKKFREKIKDQGYEQTLVALSWNILEIKSELAELRKGK